MKRKEVKSRWCKTEILVIDEISMLSAEMFDILSFIGENGTEWTRIEQNRTEQNRTEQNRTEQNRTEQNRTEWNGMEWNRMEQNRIEQNRTEQNNARCIPVLWSVVK